MVLGALAAVAAGISYFFWPQIYALIEEEMIYAAKARHWAAYSTGQTLPDTPDLKNLPARLAAQNLQLGAPVFVRIFKREFELEMWMKRGDKFETFRDLPDLHVVGETRSEIEAGRPPGAGGLLYGRTIHRSIRTANIIARSISDFPTPSTAHMVAPARLLMVHGDCRSIGCYAMTDPVIDEIWALLTAALGAGQKRVQVQVFPFRMTETNMSLHAADPDIGFWRQLKPGHDAFERDHVPPIVSVCDGRYAFRPATGDSDGSAPIDVSCPAT